jgi:hypothetical protein
LEVAEPLEAESEEGMEPTQAEVENSVLRAFIDISYSTRNNRASKSNNNPNVIQKHILTRPIFDHITRICRKIPI